VSNLRESKNEWCCYLVDIMTPLMAQGVRSIFQTAYKMCLEKNEVSKYLMTFQNLLSQVSKWNANTIEEERKRIVENSGCSYIEELIVCVHIIHLKVMTHIRVGNKQKKVDISLPKLDDFVHKCYIHIARRVYKNVYLFEMGIDSLTQQKYNRELELLVQESVLATVRDSIPKEQIIRAFMDETVETEEEVIVSAAPSVPAVESQEKTAESPLASALKATEPEIPSAVPSINNIDDSVHTTRLSFNDYDSMLSVDKQEDSVYAPKDLESLEKAAAERARKQQQEEEESRLKLSDSILSLDDLGIVSLDTVDPIQEVAPPIDDLMGLLDIQTI
jgi:hypothetical protein